MTKRHSVMTAPRSVSFMVWVTILLILAGVSTCQIAKPKVTGKAAADVQQQEQESATLASALYEEARYRASAEVAK